MPRTARIVVPGYPHHVTQRGNRGQATFLEDADYQSYLDLLIEHKDKAGVEIWAYCLMPNHVHVVAVPRRTQSLAGLFGIIHRRYALQFNSERSWTGHLWQDRFYSTVMDEAHLLSAVRYIEVNPLRAGLCVSPGDWRWSSARAHLRDEPDGLVAIDAMRERISDWCTYLSNDPSPDMVDSLRKHTRTGRPAGGKRFQEKLETLTGRRLRPRKPGPTAGR